MDQSTDPYIPIRDIPATIASWTGNRTKPSRSVVYRWLKNGNRGVKLRRCLIGSVQHTRESWLREFIEATATLHAVEPPPQLRRRTKSSRDNTKQRSQSAQRQLASMGI